MRAVMNWSKERGARLQELIGHHGQKELAQTAGVSVATWQRTIAGERAPTVEEAARLSALLSPEDLPHLVSVVFDTFDTAGTSKAVPKVASQPSSALVQDQKRVADTVEIPVHDVQVAAGAGRIADRLPPPIYHWTFSRQWMEANLRGVGQLVMVEVSGSSQEPELSDGDLVAVDLDQSRLREGLFVVRLDDLLVIKHIQVDGRIVRLMSRNPLYDPVEIDMHEPGIDERFEVVGRAVWASKML